MKSSDGELDDTLNDARPHRATTAPTEPRVDDTSVSDSLAGYSFSEVIGRGGMGEVVLARDLRIDRDVAIKRLKTATPSKDDVVRFLREAKIQARLDHPAIVPVHELGHDANGQPYFTMKRLSGVTLGDLLAAGTEPRQRLLRAFVDVALAVELAHSRGIIHRDLKPANIMLGDFGAVYLLDWGLARILAEPSETAQTVAAPATPHQGVTAIGALLGTPGYMSPEQILDASGVERPTDSYALGAILFEILAGEPLHPRESAIASTLEGVDGSPSRRCPDRTIPPELDSLCAVAVANDPTTRPTAHVLAERVQSYLDGDRDLVRRREIAHEELLRARAYLAADRRDEAMRGAGRALALDPTSEAAEIVSLLMLQPAATPSPELLKQLRAADAELIRSRARNALLAYLTFVMLIPIVVWNGVNSWPLIGGIFLLVGFLALLARSISHHPGQCRREMWIYAFANVVLLGLLTRVCSPLVLAPAAACIVTASLVSYPLFFERHWLLVAALVGGWMAPIVLEVVGFLPSTWHLETDALVIQSHVISLGGVSTVALLFGVSACTIGLAGSIAGSVARANHQAQRELVRQKWQLSQLIPN